MSTLEQRLKGLEEELGLRRGWMGALATHCGLKGASVSGWYTGGTKTMEGENLVAAAAFLGVNTPWLASGKGRKWSADAPKAPAMTYAKHPVQSVDSGSDAPAAVDDAQEPPPNIEPHLIDQAVTIMVAAPGTDPARRELFDKARLKAWHSRDKFTPDDFQRLMQGLDWLENPSLGSGH